MIRWTALGLSASLMVIPMLSAPRAQAAQAAAQQPVRRVTLDIKTVPLRDALGLLFSGSKLSYNVTGEVGNDPVSLQVTDTPLPNALRLLLQAASSDKQRLTYSVQGGVYHISAQRTAPPAAETLFQVYRLRFRPAAEVAEFLTGNAALMPPGVETVVASPRDNSLLVKASREDLEKLTEIVMMLDVETSAVEVRAEVAVIGGKSFSTEGRTMSGTVLVLDEEVEGPEGASRLKVTLTPTLRQDGRIDIESDWDIQLPLEEGAGAPDRLVKRLRNTTQLQPDRITRISQVQLPGERAVRVEIRLTARPVGEAE
ncbi:MAG: secretin N-terminal domain-containing protein [Armatimonadota bacterium]